MEVRTWPKDGKQLSAVLKLAHAFYRWQMTLARRERPNGRTRRSDQLQDSMSPLTAAL
jgi:hypothetical protein